MTHIVIIFSTTFIGFLVATHLCKQKLAREILMKDLVSFCRLLLNNLKYSKLTVEQCYQQNSENFSSQFNDIFNSFLNDERLNVNDRLISDFFSNINLKNSNLLETHLLSYEELFSQSLESARKEREEKSTIYQKLGLLSGVAIGLLLI